MEYDITYSPYQRGTSRRKLQQRQDSSSDSSTNELSYISSRNQRKRFWKGGEHENFSIVKTNQFGDNDGTNSNHKLLKGEINDLHLHPTECHKKRTTIQLTNVPVKLNNILDLYHRFSQFGTINLIQAQRNSNPFCAILSFQTTEEAIKAMKNINNVIINGEAVWFLDICVLNASANFSGDSHHSLKGTNNEMINLSDKLNYTPVFNSVDHSAESRNYDMSNEHNDILEGAITELISKKKKLLSHQTDSRREILQKVNKYQSGSNEQKILLELLNKIQRQIYENKKSIEYSMRQKAEYLANEKKSSRHNFAKKSKPNCPPWITAYKSSTAKRTDKIYSQRSRQKIRKQFKPTILPAYQACSGSDGNLTSSSASEDERTDSSESPVLGKYFYASGTYWNTKTGQSRRKKALRTRVDLIQDERYVYELDSLLLSDSTND